MCIISWKEKYELCLKEDLTVKEIMLLRSVGQPKAMEIRRKCVDYCVKNKIKLAPQKIPTYVVNEVTGKNLEYYYQQMLKENEVIKVISCSK